MKKVLIIALALALVLTLAAGCSGNDSKASEGSVKGVDALPAGSADIDDLSADLEVGDMKTMLADDGFLGRSADDALVAPVHDDWVVLSKD